MHRSDLSPLCIAFLGLLSGVALLSVLYCIAKFLYHQSLVPRPTNRMPMVSTSQDQDESLPNITSCGNSEIQLITVYKYADETREDTCSVCLSEFAKGEDVSMLPDCAHTYHVSCIDMWLQTHLNCPLCRATTVPSTRVPQHTLQLLDRFNSMPSLVEI